MLVLTLGEYIAEIAWSFLNIPKEGILTDLSAFQRAMESIGEGDDRQTQRAKVTKCASEVTEVLIENPSKWDQIQLPEGLSKLSQDKDSEETKLLARIIEREILRALRRQLTRRSLIYDLFVEFYIDRGALKFLRRLYK